MAIWWHFLLDIISFLQIFFGLTIGISENKKETQMYKKKTHSAAFKYEVSIAAIKGYQTQA